MDTPRTPRVRLLCPAAPLLRRRGQSGLTPNPHASRTVKESGRDVETLAYFRNRHLSFDIADQRIPSRSVHSGPPGCR
ncbi:hypothetical protein SBA3_4100002 [Candidatus Sulfopaludibacter sp. SbA3]|nr:hypothetical protein SBA3_4100002 [Candidatus Sulfopaludibacter sp. SbA3]